MANNDNPHTERFMQKMTIPYSPRPVPLPERYDPQVNLDQAEYRKRIEECAKIPINIIIVTGNDPGDESDGK